MSLLELIELIKTVFTLAIAISAAIIAWQQLKASRNKLTLDLYDRRLKVYVELQKILGQIALHTDASYEDLSKFKWATAESVFLFQPDIASYIENVLSHAFNLRSWNSQYRDLTQSKPEGYDHQKVCDGSATELQWLITQFEPSREIFKKYLDLSKI